MGTRSMSFRLKTSLSRWRASLSWKQAIAALFTLAVIGVLAVTLAVNWQTLREYDWHLRPGFLVASLLAHLISLWFGATTWHYIVWSMDRRVPYPVGVKFYLQSHIAKRVPGLVWYALGRLYLYDREGVGKSAVSVALTLEVVAMVVGAVIAYTATFWAGSSNISALRSWWLVLPLAGVTAVMIWPGSLYTLVNWALVRRGHRPLERQASRINLLQWSLLEACATVAGGLFIALIAAGVSSELTWTDLVPIINAWAGAALVSLVALFLPLGLGLKEITLAYLLSSIVPWPEAVLITVLGRIIGTVWDCMALAIATRL